MIAAIYILLKICFITIVQWYVYSRNDEINLNYQTLRTAERLVKYCDKPRLEKPFVVWIHGKPGTGKTRMAIDIFSDSIERYYFKSNGAGKWWSGYDGENRIIIDDLRRSNYEYPYILGLLDRYPFQVEDKGSIRQFKGTFIIITCPNSPK